MLSSQPKRNLSHWRGVPAFALALAMAVAVVAIGLLVAAPTAWAASEDAGLPQLDITTWPTQIFWLVVSFALAYVLMWRVVVPAIGSVLEERHSRVQDDLKRARLAADEAAALRAEVEAQLTQVRSEASNNTRAASEAVHAKMDAQVRAASEALRQKMSAAEASIATAKNKVLAEAADMAALAAAEAVEKLTNIKTAPDEAAAHIAALASKGDA